MTAALGGIAQLSDISEEMSSEEVARRLAQASQGLETARTAVSESIESLENARSCAEQADAESLVHLVDSAEENLATGREALASAVTDIQVENAEATTWGQLTGGGASPPDGGSSDSRVTPAGGDSSASHTDTSYLANGDDGLPHAAKAKIPEAKFVRYSMDPNAKNNGKWKAWRDLGYDIENDRQAAAEDVTRQLRRGLGTSPVEHPQDTPYGRRVTTGTHIRGPNGRNGTLRCVWQYDHGTDEPRLITNWLEVHRERSRDDHQ